MLFAHHTPAECQQHLPKLSKAIADGIGQEQLKQEYLDFSKEDFAELFSIAKARLKADKLPPEFRNTLFYTEEQLRFCTNWLIAEYRAKRLKCDTIIEVGSGIGIQTIAFSRSCKKVIAIELDPVKIRYAEENLRLAGCENVTLICGNVLDELPKLKGDILFCEPEREAETAQRTFGELKPNIRKLLAASPVENACIELPPQLKSVPLQGEREYVSVEGKLNRQHLYLGALAKCTVSAVALPSQARLEKEEGERHQKFIPPMKFLYEIDAAVVKAGLQSMLLNNSIRPVSSDFLTSSTTQKSPFFVAMYRIEASIPFDAARILAELQQLKAGKVILRYAVPAEQYWKERRQYERHLRGERTLYLFRFWATAYLAALN